MPNGNNAPQDLSVSEREMIPVLEERLEVAVETRQTGVVRLHKAVEERTETVDVPLTSVTWQVQHVPVDRVVEEAPPVRQEGDTTIYPVMEERLVRQLVLREEVHVTRLSTRRTETSSQTLLREVVEVTRDDA